MKTLYGESTKKAINNFAISGYKMPELFIKNLIILKKCTAISAYKLKEIDKNKYDAIVKACDALLASNYMEHFPVDIFQTGSGTSTNMNANEVIATLASEQSKISIHPNDDVNWGQSSNCVIPSVISITNRLLVDNLLSELSLLEKSINVIVHNNKKTYKIGRTHLQDAVPMTIAQEFSAFSSQIKANIKRINYVKKQLEYIPIGGTAVGTGLTSHKEFSRQVCKELTENLGVTFKPSKNKFMDIATKDTQVFLMSTLSTLSVSLIKIANDLRLLSSGPKTGIGEISFKKLQAGSSIMPGKVNPVIAESIIQVGAFVIGKNQAVIIAGQNSPLQLNMMMPLIAHETIESLRILTNAIKIFREKGIENIVINKEKAYSWVQQSAALITPLIHHPKIGYDLATKIVEEANKKQISIKECLRQKKIIDERELDELLNIEKMANC